MSEIRAPRSPRGRGQASQHSYSIRWVFSAAVPVLIILCCPATDSTALANKLASAPPAAPTIEVAPGRTRIKVRSVDVPRPAIASGGGRIVVEDSLCDFGEVVPSAKAEGSFTFKNEGKGPLKVTRVQGCCGAVIKISKGEEVLDIKKGFELAPGEEGRLDVDYSFSYVGPMEKKIHLFTDDPDNRDVVLTIKGMVVRKLKWTPERIRLYLDQENGGCRPITIKSVDGKPFALKSVRVTGKCFSLDVDPNQEASEFTLRPKVNLDVLQALAMPKGRITIEHTHPGCDDISLNFDLIPRYVHLPPRFLLFNVIPGQTLKRQLIVQDNYAQDQSNRVKAAGGPNVTPTPPTFALESVSCEHNSAVLTKQEAVNDGYKLYFDITPPAVKTDRRFQDYILIRIEGGQEQRVLVQGYYSTKVLQEARQPSVSQISR